MKYVLMRIEAVGATLLSMHDTYAQALAARDVQTAADALAHNTNRTAAYNVGDASPDEKVASNFESNYNIQDVR